MQLLPKISFNKGEKEKELSLCSFPMRAFFLCLFLLMMQPHTLQKRLKNFSRIAEPTRQLCKLLDGLDLITKVKLY